MTETLAELGEVAWTARDLYPILAVPHGDRAALAAEVARLRAEGLLYREVAERLGISRSYAADLATDPRGLKARARKASYQGTCGLCGGPTDGSNGYDQAPRFCLRCEPIARRIERGWTPARIVAAFQEAARILGRPPTTTDRMAAPTIRARLSEARLVEADVLQEAIANGLRFPSPGAVLAVFGSWAAALKAAGLPVEQNGGSPSHRGRRLNGSAPPPPLSRMPAGTVCPSCGDFVRSLDEETGWCGPCARASRRA